MKYLIILLSVILFSCSPQWRLNHLEKNHPELFQVRIDTIKDTVIIKGGSVDTLIKNTITKDTVVIQNNTQTIKYFNDGKVIYLKGETRDTTIIREIHVKDSTPVIRERYVPDLYKFGLWGFITLLCLITLYIILRATNKIKV